MIIDKKKVLVVANKIPYPPHSGDQIRKLNLLQILSKYFDVDLIVITEEKPKQESIDFLQNICTEVKFFYFPKYRFLINVFRFPFNKWPLDINYYYFSSVKKYIDSIDKKYHYFFANMLRTARYSKGLDTVLIVDVVDSYSLGYKQSIKNVQSLFWKVIYKIEIPRLNYAETFYNKVSKETYYVNSRDAQYWSNYGNSVWTPNGVNNNIFNTEKIVLPKASIAFLGKMDYQPNLDAMVWFEKNVFKELPIELEFYILGKDPTTKIKKLYQKYTNAKITGFVENPFIILNSCICIVAPMLTGAGLQNKVLEAMALGKIIILTSYAAQPIIGGIDKVHFLIADDGQTFQKYINEILNNQDKYRNIGINAQLLVKSVYNWNQLDNQIRSLADI